MKVTIDPYAGFCFGVERAIRIAEENTYGEIPLKSLGDLVHNEQENKRLAGKGIKSIPREVFMNLKHGRILFRAHGEPPESYLNACRNNTKVVDATCPVVKKLQSRVAKNAREMRKKGGRVVIFGRKDHPEVIGLLGQDKENIMVVSSMDEVAMTVFPPKVRMFAQTTRGLEEYLLLQAAVLRRLNNLHPSNDVDFKAFNTICKQVSGRENKIRTFGKEHDIVIFVGGKESSNGKLLFGFVKEENPKSYYISSPDEILPEWFENVSHVGVTGSTSTPSWLMEEVSKAIEKL
jgi:4-hydroxy-3-methylbut-2-enyl diphosphate reductase